MSTDPVLCHFSDKGQRIEVVEAVGRRDLPVSFHVLVGTGKADGEERSVLSGVLPDCGVDVAAPERGCLFSVCSSHVVPPLKNVGWLSHRTREPIDIFQGDEPGSRRAYRSGISSAHDSGAGLAWVMPRAGEKPAGGRAVMATTESRGAVEADIVPPCQRNTGQ